MRTLKLKSLRLKCAIGHGINDIYWFVLPSVLPLILDQFGLRYRAGGFILTAYLMVIAIFSSIIGKLSDSIDRQRIIGIGFCMAACGMTLAGVMNGFTGFIILLLLSAVGTSSFHPAGLALVDETAMSKRGKVFGFFEFWGFVAICVMFFLNSLLLRMYSWKTILIIMGSSGFLISLPFLLRKEDTLTYRSEEETGPAPFRKEGSIHLLILFLITIILRFISITAVINFTTTYLVHEMGTTPWVANLMTGFSFLGGLLLTPLFGILSDRVRPINLFLLTTGLCAPSILLLSMVYVVWLMPVILFLAGIVFYASSPSMDLLLSRFSSYIGKGEAFGYFMSVFAVITALSPALFGILADHTGLRTAIALFSIPPFLSFFVLLYTAQRMRQEQHGGMD
jgi:FSR family fosmidomycin resistance protein-like MFS transporter